MVRAAKRQKTTRSLASGTTTPAPSSSAASPNSASSGASGNAGPGQASLFRFFASPSKSAPADLGGLSPSRPAYSNSDEEVRHGSSRSGRRSAIGGEGETSRRGGVGGRSAVTSRDEQAQVDEAIRLSLAEEEERRLRNDVPAADGGMLCARPEGGRPVGDFPSSEVGGGQSTASKAADLEGLSKELFLDHEMHETAVDIGAGPVSSVSGLGQGIMGNTTAAGERGDEAECPVCGMVVKQKAIQAHVNRCLDGVGPGQSTSSLPPGDEPAPASDPSASHRCAPLAPSSNGPATASRKLTRMAVTPNFPAWPSSQGAMPSVSNDRANASSLPLKVEPRRASSSPSLDGPPSGNGNVASKRPIGRPDAFSLLMSSHAEDKAWAESDQIESDRRSGKGPRITSNNPGKPAPFYKILQGMPLAVDAFRFGRIEDIKGYFLTHFHSDHYGGLTSAWTAGPIYCSETTANLVRLSLRVPEHYIHPLPMETPVMIQGVEVTLIEANHCPGSAIFLFEGPQTINIGPGFASPHVGTGRVFRYLHCGDFRASPQHVNHPAVRRKKIDIIYLDTTYLNPRYCFPAQDQVVQACADLVLHRIATSSVDFVSGAHIKPDLSKSSFTFHTRAVSSSAAQANPLSPGANSGKTDAEESKEEVEVFLQGMQGDSRQGAALKSWLRRGAAEPDTERVSTADMQTEAEDLVDVRVKEEPADDCSPMETPSFDDLDVSMPEAAEPYAEDMEEELGGFEEEEDPIRPEDKSEALIDRNVKAESEVDEFDGGLPQACHGDVDIKDGSLDGDGSKNVEPDGEAVKDDKPALTLDGKGGLGATGRSKRGRLLVVIGTYTIGKEKIVKGESCDAIAKVDMNRTLQLIVLPPSPLGHGLEAAVAKALGSKIYCGDSRKHRIYEQLDDAELHALLTRDKALASVHVAGLHSVTREPLTDYLSSLRPYGFTHVVGFRPTGWTYRPPTGTEQMASVQQVVQRDSRRTFGMSDLYPTRDSTLECMIYGVPYSEHSSFFELSCFALSLEYDRIIATVNVHSPASRAKMTKWFEKWAQEKKRRERAGEPKMVPARAATFW